MSNPVVVNRTAKDSVFTDLFSIPKYLMQLYQALHPEDTTTQISDIRNATLKCIIADHAYNDLGFQINNRLMILVEAQSTWSPNILLRMLNYLAQSYVDFFKDSQISIYGSHKPKVPKPELYVIFTGDGEKRPKQLLLSQEFFNGVVCDVEIRINMIYGNKQGDIIQQYIRFCKVFTQQVRLHGRTHLSLKETLRICKDLKVLDEYLQEREKEVMDIMSSLFDQEVVTREFGIAKKAEGRAEGRAEALQHIMDSLSMTIDQAMDVLKISGDERKVYRKMLKKKANHKP